MKSKRPTTETTMTKITDVAQITPFTQPEECATVGHCNRLIDIYVQKRDSYAALSGAPRKKAVTMWWNHKIHAVKVVREKLVKGWEF